MPKSIINNIELYYETAGQGETVVFIHGLGSSTRDWELQIPAFSKHYQTVTFDLRGHGQSQKPLGPYSMSLFAKDTAELIKSLNVGSVHVIGISLGGMIAFQLAVDYPELIKKLVIVNSAPEVVVKTLKDRWNVFLRFAIVRLLGMRKMGEVLSKRLFPKDEHENLRQTFVEHWAENDVRAYLDTLRAIVGWSVTDKIHNIKTPTLIVAADGDYTPVATKEAYLSKLENGKLIVIEDSRHALPVEKPDEFNQKVLEFLKY
ncbi:MAG: alpha/beta hydrolase fold protein [Chloroflexi bacterium OLB14]|nr:MAG: alpha/beta hydrolase fold protein [Chloroflexi bacterium OLB14]